MFRQLFVLLAAAVLIHLAFRRLRQPAIIGEIAIGVVLGPSVLGYLNLLTFDPMLVSTFGTLGAALLLFLIGLESDLRAIYTRTNVLVALGGVLLPFAAGFSLALLVGPAGGIGPNGTEFTMAMFVGASLVATSVAIAAAILLEAGLLRDRVARTIIGAAVVDDILGLLVLSLVAATSRGGVDVLGIIGLAAAAVAFVVGGIVIGHFVLGRFVVRIHAAGTELGLRHSGFVFALAIMFLYALVAEVLGLSAIVGAFLAGAVLAPTPVRDEFTQGAGFLGAMFTPLFFISIGLAVNLPTVDASLLAFTGLLLIVAVVTKLVGCGIPARLSRMTRKEAVAVGWGMAPRGEVGLIVALTAFNVGIIANGMYSAMVLMMVLVTILPAPLFKAALAAVLRERAALRPAGDEGPAPP